MAVISGSSSGHSWPDLPPELLGLVLSRLPSHGDRVHVAAVCRPWRSNARLLRPLPPLLPWLALCDGTFLSLPDGAVHRPPIVEDVTSRLSTGSRVFLLHGDDTCSLMNPSPARTTPLPELAACLRRGRLMSWVSAAARDGSSARELGEDQRVAALQIGEAPRTAVREVGEGRRWGFPVAEPADGGAFRWQDRPAAGRRGCNEVGMRLWGAGGAGR